MIPTLGEVAQLITAAAAVGALAFSIRNGYRIKSYRVEINSRMTELMAAAGRLAHLEGIEVGRKEANGGPAASGDRAAGR